MLLLQLLLHREKLVQRLALRVLNVLDHLVLLGYTLPGVPRLGHLLIPGLQAVEDGLPLGYRRPIVLAVVLLPLHFLDLLSLFLLLLPLPHLHQLLLPIPDLLLQQQHLPVELFALDVLLAVVVAHLLEDFLALIDLDLQPRQLARHLLRELPQLLLHLIHLVLALAIDSLLHLPQVLLHLPQVYGADLELSQVLQVF